MIDFREQKELIKAIVKKVSDNDKFWKWKLKSISKSKVFINWSYLDYCEESYPKNCFTIESREESIDEDFIIARTPDGELIDVLSTGGEFPDGTVESIIERAISAIEGYAHTSY